VLGSWNFENDMTHGQMSNTTPQQIVGRLIW